MFSGDILTRSDGVSLKRSQVPPEGGTWLFFRNQALFIRTSVWIFNDYKPRTVLAVDQQQHTFRK